MNTTKIAKDILARKIRAQYPDALLYHLSSSDQNHGYGYVLMGVTFQDGDTTITRDSGSFEEFADSLDDYFGDMPWGAFGDRNADSYFDIDINTGQIIR